MSTRFVSVHILLVLLSQYTVLVEHKHSQVSRKTQSCSLLTMLRDLEIFTKRGARNVWP